MRPLLVGVAAIALFALAAFAGVFLATSGDDPPRPRAAAGGAPAAAAPAPEPTAPMPLPTGGIAGPFYRPPPAVAQEVPVPRYQPPKDSWEAIKPAARASALGPVGVDVGRDLNVLQDQLSSCFSPDVAAQSGHDAPTETADPVTRQDLAETILVLQLETGSGTVRIVDAPIESHGSTDDATIACAQRVLRGHTVRSPTAKPGGRHRLVMQLHP